MTCLNIGPTYNLLQFSIDNDGVKVEVSDNSLPDNQVWSIYLTFESWLNEIVIDTKLKEVEPLSRLLIVKIVADTMGAHVDDNNEEHLFNMAQHELLPILIKNGVEVPQDLEIKAKSIFCETILAIAKELLDSFEEWERLYPKPLGLSGTIIRTQKYNGKNKKYELLKYAAIEKSFPYEFNAYNSNSYYECEVYSKEAFLYEIEKNQKKYAIRIIDYRDVLNGEFLGKSLYPNTYDRGSDSV